MIEYEWRTELDGAELVDLTDLLDRAARYDAEPEYSTITIDDVAQSMARSDPHSRHLVIWMLPHATALGEDDHPKRIAGILRVSLEPDGSAQAVLVIDPRLRSIGITTLLLEQMGLDCAQPDGWSGTGARAITVWAQGSHPAAGRISDRFLIPRTRRVWKLIRATDSARTASAEPALVSVSAEDLRVSLWANDIDAPGALALRDDGGILGVVVLDLTAVASEEFGACATITTCRAAPTATGRDRLRLLDGAAAIAHESGLSGVIVHVDSGDAEWVNSCRLAGFQHDRTDVRYQLGGQQ